MMQMSNHSHTEIEEALLPDLTVQHNINTARRKRIFVIIFVSFFLVIAAVVTTGIVYFVFNKDKNITPTTIPTVILISLDGFRWDYLDKYKDQTPVLNKLRSDGIYSPILPMFTTKTFPNHYSIVTGLYPETHGIISNSFYDPVFDSIFTINDTSAVTDGRWWGGEPIWITAQKQGLKSGVYFWPGSEAPIQGILPSHYKAYDKKVPMETRIEGVTQWLDMADGDRPSFIAVYMEPVDDAGHAAGPDSQAVAAATAEVDSAIGHLINHLSDTGKIESTNIIVVSDHGMAQLDVSRVAILDDCIDVNTVKIIDMSPNCFIIPKNESETEFLMESLLKCKNTTYNNITPYLRDDIPAALYFNSNRRITPIVIIADLGWSIATRATYDVKYFNNTGNHGFDNRNKDMRGIFIANGPNIKKGQTFDVVPNIDVYNFLSLLLNVHPAPNNGSTFLIDNVFENA